MDHDMAVSEPSSAAAADQSGDTGLWALAAAAVQHRVSLDRLAMAHGLALGGRKALTADIVRAAAAAGLAAQVIASADQQQLLRVPLPAILRNA